MAGAAGFEPAHAEIKTQCLTAWRRPTHISYCNKLINGEVLQLSATMAL